MYSMTRDDAVCTLWQMIVNLVYPTLSYPKALFIQHSFEIHLLHMYLHWVVNKDLDLSNTWLSDTCWGQIRSNEPGPSVQTMYIRTYVHTLYKLLILYYIFSHCFLPTRRNSKFDGFSFWRHWQQHWPHAQQWTCGASLLQFSNTTRTRLVWF